MTWKSAESVGTFLRRIGAGGALLELEARQVSRALRGELNRVLNAESANLQRAVSAAGRQLDAIATLESDGRLAEQSDTVRAVAAARRETPEATLSELAERPGLHRSAVQRSLERIETLALHDDGGAGRIGRSAPACRSPTRSGMIRAMRDVIVAANWKMHTTPAEAGELARTIASRTREPGVTRVICPPFVSLAAVRDALADTDPDVGIGAQNIHHEAAGAYTGEVSAPMLAGLATWVIVGHSERRRDFGETDERIGQKLGRATDAGLRAILCVGERAEERDAGQAAAVVETQLRGALGRPRSGDAGRGRPRHRLRAGLGDRHRPDGARLGCGRDGRRDPRDAGRRSAGASAADGRPSCTAAA